MGIFISNSRRDLEILGKLERLAETALSSGVAKFTDMVKMFEANSVAAIKHELIQSDKQAQKQQAEQQLAQQEMMDKQLAVQRELAEEERAHEKELKLMERETQLMKAEIDAFKFQQDLDSNNDGIPDPLQIETLRSKERIENQKLQLEREKLQVQERIKNKEIAQKGKTPSK